MVSRINGKSFSHSCDSASGPRAPLMTGFRRAFRVADILRIAYAQFSPQGEARVSHLVHTQYPTTTARSARFQALPPWQIGVLAALSLWLYGPTLFHLVA